MNINFTCLLSEEDVANYCRSTNLDAQQDLICNKFIKSIVLFQSSDHIFNYNPATTTFDAIPSFAGLKD